MQDNVWIDGEMAVGKLRQVVGVLRLIADGLRYGEYSPEDAAGAVEFVAEGLEKSLPG